jgi:predicted acetyltransferase
MLVTDVEIRPLGPDDDMDAQADLSERAFGQMSPSEREEFKAFNIGRVRGGAFLGAFVGGRPAGAANYHDMRQWWHGRPVPMAGVAGVKMSPEYRGRGIGRRMMTQLLGQIADRGYPLATLYPATMRIYRSLGWELAGSRYWMTVPARELRALLAPDAGEITAAVNAVDIRRAVPADAAAVIAIAGRAHEAARDNGPLTRDADSVAKWLERDGLYAYIADDGFVAYRWSDDREGLRVEQFHAISPITSRALWSVLASHSSTAGTVTARLAPQDPLWWLTRERDVAVARRSMWMLRVVDAPAAIAARGFPAAVSVSVPVVLKDPVRPGNEGAWELTIAGGKGTLAASDPSGGSGPSGPAGSSGSSGAGGPAGAGGSAPLTLGARGLAALYGGTPVASLRMAGLVSGGAADADAALDAAFGGPAFMLDDF